MNEQALQDAYDLFVSNGYKKSIDDFKRLISTNPEALNDSYNLFKSQGYNKSVDDYKNLLGVSATEPTLKKKVTTASPSAVGSSVLSKPIEEKDDADYFQGAFGDVLRGFDKYSPIGLGDFIDDMARSVASGYRQGTAAQEADNLLLAGSKATPEQIQKFIDANKNASQLGQSKEMQDYMKIYEGEGKGFWGVVKGLFNNPTVIPEVLASSLTSMATNTDALKAGAAAVGTGTAYGAGTGAVAGGIGAIPGAAAGAIASVPYAFGLASSVVEMGSTFGELLSEELGGKEMTKENVKAILENPAKLQEIRNKAITRGAIIGTVDAFTGKLASGVGAKILSKSAAKSATGAATRGAVTAATAAGAGVESVGGSLGEAAARGAIGQDMDVSEIALEGLAELPGGMRSTIQARLAKPVYKVNGAKVTKEEIDNIINTMSPTDLAKTKIDIENDYEGRKYKIQDKIVTNSIKEQVKQGNPELNEPSLNAITELEKELRKLEGNTTQTGKDKAAAIRTQIKNIQENQLQEEAVVATAVAETSEVTKKRLDRIAEIEDLLNPETESLYPIQDKEKLQTELQTLKAEQDAIQKQTTGQVPVQPTTGSSQEVEGGITQAKPEGITEEGKTTEGTKEKVGVLSNVDTTATALESLPEEQKTETTFTTEEGEQLPVAGNERRVAELFHEATALPEEERTEAQKSAIEATQVSLKTQIEQEQIARMEEMFAEQEIPQAPPVSQGTSVTNKSALDQVKTQLKDAAKVSIIDSAQKVLTTLQSVLPNFDIVIHDNDDSYTAAMTSMNATPDSAGNFSYVKNPDGTYVGRIDINLNRANQRTVGHEVAHGIMLKAFGENPETFKTFKNRIASVLNESSNKQLTDFASQYAEIDSYEEYLAELTAALEQQEGKIDTTTFQKIAALINELVSKVTNGAFTPFQDIKDTKQAVEFFKNISQSMRKGEAIKPSDIAAIQEGLSVAIGSPTTITSKAQKATPLTFPKTPLPLSFVTEADKIDIDALIKEIAEKKQKVWFWMADQLGRGNYYDEVIEGEHYLDAGPSFALDPENRSKGILWASGLPEKTLAKQINEADYIFFISGSPEKAKLFNKRVLNLLEERINKTSNFNAFKDALNKFGKETVELKTMRDALDGVTSFKELADSPKRKPFLLALGEIGALKTTPAGSLKELLGSFNAFIDYNELRDGFYKENGFTQNDIMLVGKPTGLGGKAPHSTYEFAIRGEVVGVPDKKIDSWNIMPEALKEKYQGVIGGKESKTKTLQTKVIAAETGVVRGLEAQRKSKAQIIGRNANLSATAKFNLNLAEEMAKNKMSPETIRLSTGWEKGLDGKWRYEIPDGKFKDIDLGDLRRKLFEKDLTASRYGKLSDIFDAPDLYQAYPEVKDVTVKFKELPENNYGSFNIKDGLITVNEELYRKKRPEAELTMLHEIQHYVQNKELFERGSSPSYAPIMMTYIIGDFKNKVDNQKQRYENVKTVFPDNKQAIKEALNLYKLAKDRFQKVKDLALRKEEKTKKKSQGIFESTLADAFNLYYRVAGEVEARNVEYRNKLTPEERRKTMLSETENVDREDQIMFDNSEILFDDEVKNLKEEFPISKSQLSNDNKVAKLIKDARAQGFSENAIKTFLQGKGLTDSQIDTAMGKEISAAGKVTVTEEMLPGYESLMRRIDSYIDSKLPLKEILRRLKDSATYMNATDIQKEKLVRELRKKLGIREKSAPLAQRIIGAVRDITKITMSEKDLLKKQIKDLARGAKDAKKLWRQASSGLTKELKELASSGKITAKQLAAVLRKFSSVDMFNEKSIDKFVDYMTKVFGDAEYANKLDFARSMLGTAKKNIATKIGIADGLYAPLNRLFSVNPSLIPDSVLDKYLALVDMFGKRQAVLDLKEKSQVKKVTEDILDAIAEEQSLADELADRFSESPNKMFGDEGKLDFAESIKEMLKQGEITQEEADIMRKYKSDILPQVEPKKMTEQEIAEEKEGLIKEVEDANVDFSGLPTADERSLAKQLKELIRTRAIDKLSNTELKNLLKVISNINNNYLPHYAQVMVEKMNAINDGEKLSDAVSKAKLPKLTSLYAKFKNLFTGKGAILEAVRRSPLYYIDQVFSDFKTKDIFNSILKRAAEGEARFSSELKKVQNILEKAEEKIAKSFKLDPNKTLMSKYKMMTYMIQLEYDSNVGDKQVNPAADYLKATIKHIDEGKSSFAERDAEMLQKILDDYTDADGNIDNEKLFKSFNEAEKSAISDIRKINESLRGKAEYTAAIIRGDKISPLNNYVHLNVLHETQPNELTSGSAFITEYNDSMRPSTKAKSLIARTGKVSPLNFDVFASAQRGAKFVLMDYNLTEPIRTARKALNQATADLEAQGRIPKEKRQVLNAIRDAFEESIENLLTNAYISNAFLEDAIDYISKQGYRSVLAGTSRFVSELSSNIGFAIITDPAAFKTGYDNRDVIMSTDAPTIMSNVGSTQTNRIFPTDTLSGKLIDTNVMKQASGIKGGRAKGYIANKIQQIFNRTGKKYLNAVELTADALISTPDKIVMRPIWFGSFANEFKKVTGKDVDFKKIAANDQAYMSSNKEALDRAKTVADERSVFTGASDNAFMGILKGTPKPNKSGWLRAFNNFNNFMTRFLIFEYATARTGINAAMGNGTLTKKQGAALVAAVTTRMMVYSLLTQALGNGLMGLFFDDEEEEDDDSILQNIGQAFASAFSSMVLGRDFGNATKLFINEGVERANEEYLDFLRTGEYDRYEDNIQNSLVPQEKKGRQTGIWDYVKNMGGAFTPMLKTADLIIKNKTAAEPKTAEAIKRREKESNVRIPLEIAGNLGLVPMYKDIRKAALNDIYKDLDKNKGVEIEPLSENQNDQIEALRQLKETTQNDDAISEINKKIREIQATGEQKKKYEEASKRESEKKKRLLYDSDEGVRYDNPSEMKKYNPSLYNERFGPESDWYQDHKAEADIEKAMNKEIREMEDVEYEYTPKPKNKSSRNSDGTIRRSSYRRGTN